METGGRPDRGVCAAVDVHYLSTGGARAAAVLAADAAFAHVLAERTAVVTQVPPYRPGESTCASSRRCARSWRI
jgi:deoxyinosine 3'endonuclease (endonuclease V)